MESFHHLDLNYYDLVRSYKCVDLSSNLLFTTIHIYNNLIHTKDYADMLSNSVQAFNDKVAADPALRTKIRVLTSPLAFLALAKSEGLDLSGQDFQILVQQAYQQWIGQLEPKMSSFFSQVHDRKALDARLKVCQSSHDVIELAQECGVILSEDDLRQAAMVAEAISGFSFEKLWFRGLGLIN
jgi:predicted ribosomally synthesized peptide with nif11-like leader